MQLGAGLGGSRTLHESRWQHNQRTKLHKGSSADRDDEEVGKREVEIREGPSCWVPHYRTGIYYPRGHERVMDDIPEGAASFGETSFWLRNIDGVDKPDQDVPAY